MHTPKRSDPATPRPASATTLTPDGQVVRTRDAQEPGRRARPWLNLRTLAALAALGTIPPASCALVNLLSAPHSTGSDWTQGWAIFISSAAELPEIGARAAHMILIQAWQPAGVYTIALALPALCAYFATRTLRHARSDHGRAAATGAFACSLLCATAWQWLARLIEA